FLLDAGADPEPLEWTTLMLAIATGIVEEVRSELDDEPDLAELDRWERTPFLLSLQTGDLEKVRLLAAVSEIDTLGNYSNTPLMHAIESRQTGVLQWLLEQGQNPDAKDDFGETALIMAAKSGATECVRVLIEAGADIALTDAREGEPTPISDEEKAEFEERMQGYLTGDLGDDFEGFDISDMAEAETEGERAIQLAANLDIVRLLVEAGEDLSAISPEMRAELVGLEVEGEPDCTPDDFEKGRQRRFGTSNPEKVEVPFWNAMTRSGATAWRARDLFGDTELDDDSAVWSFARFGKSLTELPDGRIIEIGGEHEDFYDVDFCIYNDVFVHHGGGKFEIYSYPEAVFPPTDFHSATLVGDFIYIIGSLGYPEGRFDGETPVYRLDINTLAIEKVETSGENPGWISSHRAVYKAESGEIEIFGGKVWGIDEVEKAEFYDENELRYGLDLEQLVWRVIE
ncbi:ankyrin repeat domain-containing protein, partial [bacterium]